MKNHIFYGNNDKLIKNLPNNSIDFIATSPPYDDMRDYEGYDWDIKKLAPELYRVLKTGRILVWIIRDTKEDFNLKLLPFEHAKEFQKTGFKVLDIMIWEKIANFPSKMCYQDSFEYMLVLSKGKPKIFNGIKDRISNEPRIRKSSNTKRNKKTGEIEKKKGKDFRINKQVLRTNIWKFQPNQFNISENWELVKEHPAIFPLQIIKDLIVSFSNEHELILDPFMGSGTTAIACLETNRNYIGFEISKKYCNIINKRIKTWKTTPRMKKDYLLNYNT